MLRRSHKQPDGEYNDINALGAFSSSAHTAGIADSTKIAKEIPTHSPARLEGIRQQIVDCGFSSEAAHEALKRKSSSQGAIEWILSPEGSAILRTQDAVGNPGSYQKQDPQTATLVRELMECGLGFNKDQAEAAALRCSSRDRCIEWILGTISKTQQNQEDDQEHECGICYCDEVQSQMILCECQPNLHWICRDCLGNWCQTKINAHEVLQIGCPHGLDGCQSDLSHFIVTSVVDEDYRDKYQRLLMEKDWAQGNDHVVRCPACSFMTEWENDSQLNSIVCHNQACETKAFCGRCGMRPHFRKGDPEMNMDCAAYAKWKAENDGADNAFQAYMANNQVQACPACHEACEKQGGCNFMYCKCKAMFCLHCGSALTEKDHYSHFGKYGPYGHGCLNKAA